MSIINTLFFFISMYSMRNLIIEMNRRNIKPLSCFIAIYYYCCGMNIKNILFGNFSLYHNETS